MINVTELVLDMEELEGSIITSRGFPSLQWHISLIQGSGPELGREPSGMMWAGSGTQAAIFSDWSSRSQIYLGRSAQVANLSLFWND